MWIAVLFTCMFGPEIVTSIVTGRGVVVAVFAFLATVPVAVFGFRR